MVIWSMLWTFLIYNSTSNFQKLVNGIQRIIYLELNHKMILEMGKLHTSEKMCSSCCTQETVLHMRQLRAIKVEHYTNFEH